MLTNIDDRTNIYGMGKIHSMGDIDNTIDPMTVESDFLKDFLGSDTKKEYSASMEFQNNLKQLESYSSSNYNDPNAGLQLDARSISQTPSKNFMPPSTSSRAVASPTFYRDSPAPMSAMPVRNDFNTLSPSRERTMEQLRYGAPSKTEEERVSNALGEMLHNSSYKSSIIPLVIEDDKEELLEDCISLRDELKEIGVNVSNIPEPNGAMSKEELERIYKRLLIKNNKKRAGTTAEELIMLGARGLGKLFNGQTEWFGYRLDARGWDTTVKGKLKRMRYDTSSWVSGVMKEWTMSSGARIGIELVPSFLLCLATNKGDDYTPEGSKKPSYSDQEWANSIAEIADTE
jgi:hypothetical protein